jgi:hypothetical protein
MIYFLILKETNVVLLCSGGRVKNIVFTNGALEEITSGEAMSDFWSLHK